MVYFLTKRLLQFFPTLLGAVSLIFFMVMWAPGYPAQTILGERASSQQLQEMHTEQGIGSPVIAQYFTHISNVLHLDLGNSIRTGRSILSEIIELLPATIELAVITIIHAIIFGILFGVLAAVKQNSLLDYGVMSSAIIGISMPVFWVGIIAIMIFSVYLDWLPTGGRINARYFITPITNFYIIDSIILWFREGSAKYLFSALKHLVLPVLVLGSIPTAIIARTTRATMLEIISEDYIQAARAAGIAENKIIISHALRNAALPIITVCATQFGTLLSAAILTESIFSWPGLGRWLYKAIEARDLPAIQGGVILVVLLYMTINLLVDIFYTIIDPRIKWGGK